MARTTLACREWGEGEPLLLVHGLLGTGGNWQSLARDLGDAWRVLAPDLRNHGRSPHLPTMTLGEMADDLAGLLDEHGLARAAVGGHSLGGKVVMALALLHPERVTRLLVEDVAPVTYSAPMRRTVEAMAALPLRELRSLQDANERLRRAIANPEVCNFLLTNLKSGPDGYHWRVNLQTIRDALEALSTFPDDLGARRYGGPCLFLCGGRSNYVRPQDEPLIRTFFPEAEVRWLPEAGHWVHSDQPREFVAHARAFLAGDELPLTLEVRRRADLGAPAASPPASPPPPEPAP